MIVPYDHTVRDATGAVVTGLTPTFTFFRNSSDLSHYTPQPSIVELAGALAGTYRFTHDWIPVDARCLYFSTPCRPKRGMGTQATSTPA